MKVVYIRSSTDEKQRVSFDGQARLIEEKFGPSDVIFYDRDSGSNNFRLGYLSFLSYLALNPKSTVYIYDWDRLSRDAITLLQVRNTFEALKIKVFTLSGTNFEDTPEGRLMYTVRAGFAQFEREKIVQRVRNGLKNARAKGIVLGRPFKICPRDLQEKISSGMGIADLSSFYGVNKSTIYRGLKRTIV